MKKKSVLVVGDVMVDIFNYGKAVRLSPEAPVPVFINHRTEYVPGGAANLAMNLSNLGFKVHLCGPIGDCSYSKILEEMLKDQFIHLHMNKLIGEKVTTKTRFVDESNNHQVGLRLDNDMKTPSLIQMDKTVVPNTGFDAVVFSDYCKGCFDNLLFVRDLISFLPDRKNCPLFLDSRREDLKRFSGFTHFKPNLKEFNFYKSEINNGLIFENIMRTESESGMSFFKFPLKSSQFHVDATEKSIVDPTGAGDTAMAGWIWAVLSGYSDQDCIRIANQLAGVACIHKGTYAVSDIDLNHSLMRIGFI